MLKALREQNRIVGKDYKTITDLSNRLYKLSLTLSEGKESVKRSLDWVNNLMVYDSFTDQEYRELNNRIAGIEKDVAALKKFVESTFTSSRIIH